MRYCAHLPLVLRRLTLLLHRYPNGSSINGFLKKGDRLGAVIKRDAEYLVSAGVTRRAIADFLEKAISHVAADDDGFPPPSKDPVPDPAESPHAKLTVNMEGYMGWQDDPFNPSFGNPAALGTSSDFMIMPYRVSFPGLITTLIRRLCFFESSVYRVEPAKVVPLLQRAFATSKRP